jgi:hypothetical protein
MSVTEEPWMGRGVNDYRRAVQSALTSWLAGADITTEDAAVGQNRKDRGSYCSADAPPAMPRATCSAGAGMRGACAWGSARGHTEPEPGHVEARAVFYAITKPLYRDAITYLFPFYGTRFLGLPRAMSNTDTGYWHSAMCLSGSNSIMVAILLVTFPGAWPHWLRFPELLANWPTF